MDVFENEGLSLFPYPLGDVSVMWNLRGVKVDKWVELLLWASLFFWDGEVYPVIPRIILAFFISVKL